MEHYYSKNPQSTFLIETWEYSFENKIFTFTSGSGVFSKGRIDFGSELLMKSFQEPPIPGNILDFGCGYGPIGIVLAKKYNDRTITMIDINERAIELAKKNIQQNSVKNTELILTDGTSKLTDMQSYAAILMNPPIRTGKEKVYELFAQSKQSLLPQGELWIVIQKKQGAASAQKYLSSLFSQVSIINKKKGYFILKCK